ncbi:MAG: hypothetical protein IK049_03340, partial [Oscillospiraceae bacterium]|nr:hypothetical protein [Oscillospiraceae bacterium]
MTTVLNDYSIPTQARDTAKNDAASRRRRHLLVSDCSKEVILRGRSCLSVAAENVDDLVHYELLDSFA